MELTEKDAQLQVVRISFGRGIVPHITLVGMALVVITLAVYWQVGTHDFLNLDDDVYVTNNPHVATGMTGPNITWAFTSVYADNWHPVTWLSHMADVTIYGMNPRGHHLTNVIIHAATTVLLLLLLFRLTGQLWQSSFVAAMFALHPLHVESVAWVAERKDVLSAFFWFLTLLLYAAYAREEKPALYVFALLSFILGLMSKPMLVTLPLVMLLLDFWPLDRRAFEGQTGLCRFPRSVLLKEKVPFCVCSLLSAVVTIYAQHAGGAMRTFSAEPLASRMGNAVTAYVKYLSKTLWPHDLAVLYPFPPSFPLWQVIGSLLVLLLITVAAIVTKRRHPYLAMGWFWFLITLVPVIGIVQVGMQPMADRYTYLPQTGLFIMAAWGVPELARQLRYRQEIIALIACAAIATSVVLTWRQLGYWQDNISLYRHTLRVTSGNFFAHGNLGMALEAKGDLAGAIREYREALGIKPTYCQAHINLGNALFYKSDPDAAIKEYQEALRIKPDSLEAHNDLGYVLAVRGELDGAITEYQRALRVNPDSLTVHFNLGNALAAKGELDAAIGEYREALSINPNVVAARQSLLTALARKRSGR